jgi:hypothetical protein
MVRIIETPELENISRKPKLTSSTTPEEKEQFCPKGKDSTDAIKVDVSQQKDIINKLGDSKCKSELQDELQIFVDSQRRLGLTSFGGGLQIDQKAFENHVSNSSASGCLQSLVQSNTALGVMNSLTCNATFSRNESAITITENTNISIRTIKTEAAEERETIAYARHAAMVDKLLSYPPSSAVLALLREVNRDWEEELKSFDYGLYNARIVLDSQHVANIESTSNSKIEDETSAIEDLKTLVKTSTAAEIKEKTGYGAKPGGDSMTAIQQKVDNLVQSDLVKIVNSVNQTNYSRDSAGGVVLEIAGPIRDLNIQSHQGDLIGFKTTMLMSEAQKIGKRLANEFITEARLSLTRTTESTGLDDYQKAINEGIKAAIEGQNAGGFGSMGMMFLLPIIGLLIGGYLFYKFTIGGGLVGIAIKIALIVFVVLAIYLAVAYFMKLWPFTEKEKSEIILPNNRWLRSLTINDIDKIIEPISIRKIKQDARKNLLDLFIYQRTKTKEDYINGLSTKPERVSMAVFIEGWNNGLNSFEFMKNYLAMPFDMHTEKVSKGDLGKYPQWALDIANKEELNWDSTNIRDVAKFVDANVRSVFSQKDNMKRRTKYGSSSLEYTKRTNTKKPYQK